jgi:hypothetical protein
LDLLELTEQRALPVQQVQDRLAQPVILDLLALSVTRVLLEQLVQDKPVQQV